MLEHGLRPALDDAEIERERDAAIAELRKESVDLALAAATRLRQENLDQD